MDVCLHSATKNAFVCRHKPLLPDIATGDVITTVLAVIFCALAAAGGVGGGALLIPLFALLCSFPAPQAVAMSSVTILGGAIANFLLYRTRTHPFDPTKPLIDYEIAITMEPLALAGSIIGVQLARLLPEWLLILILLGLLVVTTYRTTIRARSLYQAESEGLLGRSGRERLGGPGPGESMAGSDFYDKESLLVPYMVMGGDNGHWEGTSGADTIDDGDDEMGSSDATSPLSSSSAKHDMSSQATQQYLKHQPSPDTDINSNGDLDATGWQQTTSAVCGAVSAWFNILSLRQATVLVLLSCNVVIFIHSIIVGGEGRIGYLTHACGGLWFWVVAFSPVALLCLVAYRSVIFVRNRMEVRSAGGLLLHLSDRKRIALSSSTYAIVSSLAGVFAGMVGIGGGTLKAPLLFEMGVVPEATAATVSFMILFTSLSACTQYVVHGMLTLDYGGWFLLVGFLSTFFGHLTATSIIRKLNRPSLVIGAVATLLALGGVMLTVQFTSNLRRELDGGHHLGFKDMCK